MVKTQLHEVTGENRSCGPTAISTEKPLRMIPAERQQWLLEYMRAKQRGKSYRLYFNILDSDFSDAYIEATKAKHQPMAFGSFKCSALGSDLGALFRAGLLQRNSSGLPSGSANEGFPKWVYEYSL